MLLLSAELSGQPLWSDRPVLLSTRYGADSHKVTRALEALKRPREKPEFKDTMICALTGFAPGDSDLRSQEQTGFHHLQVKPVNITGLL